MAEKKFTEKELHWRELLERQAVSGRSIRKFCAGEGISEPSFYAWRRKLRGRMNDAPSARKASRSANANDDGLFVSLKLLDPTPMLEIIHPLGCRVHVNGDVDPAALRRVIEALDERGGR